MYREYTLDEAKQEATSRLKELGYSDEYIKTMTDNFIKMVAPSRVLYRCRDGSTIELHLD